MSAKQLEAIEKILGPNGKCYGSKGQYRADHENHMVCFNANVCTVEGKLWHGDIDITISEEDLRMLANSLNQKIYVLYEMDARFENEKAPKLEKAVYWTDGELCGFNEHYQRGEMGRLEAIPHVIPEPTAEEVAKAKKEYVAEQYKSLGKIPKFKATKKSSPVEALMLAICKQLDIKPPGKLDTWKIWVSSELYSALKEKTVEWAKKQHPHMTKYRAESSVEWLFFEIAPQHFRYDPDWVKGDEFYVKGEYITA